MQPPLLVIVKRGNEREIWGDPDSCGTYQTLKAITYTGAIADVVVEAIDAWMEEGRRLAKAR